MRTFRSRFLMVAGLAGTAGLLVNVNCGGGGGGTGGSTGSGGTTSTGGKGGSSTGGTTGSGGSATGGKGGSGTGGNATGGAAGAGTGGAAGGGGGANGGSAGGANGGSAGGANGGAGGKAGAGGATGGTAGSNTDGGTQQYAAFNYTFDKDVQGWGFNTNDKPTDGSINLSLVDGGAVPSLAWDNLVGDPDAGSLEVQATFSGYRQFVQAAIGVKPIIDPTGRTAKAWVMLDKQDGGSALPVGAQFEINSGPGFTGFAGTAYTALTPGTWTPLTIPLTKSSSFDPSQIFQIAVQFITESQPDGGAAFGAPVHATFHIDTVTDGSGLPLPPPVYYTFDTSTQGWQMATGIAALDGGTAPAVSWDSANGVEGGSLKATVEFTAYNQNFSVQVNPQPFIDLTNKTITAHIKLDSGALPAGTSSNYVQLHVSSGTGFVYANSPTGSSFTSTSAGTYMTLTFNLGSGFTPPSGFDVTKISQIGIQVGINSGPDGGTFPTPTPLTFHFDSVISQ